jgi:uncharacterized protein YhdP
MDVTEKTARAASARAAPTLRWAFAACLALVALGGVTLFAYRIALARVPQYRAALERLVRTRTGLDVRFNELGLSWGWYGPEAVFRGVELGEPGRGALMRASELIVDFDVWHAMHTGELEAQRVTLIAPDIDLARLQALSARTPESGHAARQHGSPTAASAAADLLERWPGGRMDLQDAMFTLPDPAHASRTLRLDVRRATLLRSGHTWKVYAQAFLPQRLGRSATLTLQFESSRPQLPASGTLLLTGRGVQFGGWRDILRATWPSVPYLPSAGIGNVRLSLSFTKGGLSDASGEIHADEVAVRPGAASEDAIRAPREVPVALFSSEQPMGGAQAELPIGRVQGVFDLRQISSGHWQLGTEGTTIGPLHVASLEASWAHGAVPDLRIEAMADGRIEEVLSWLSRSPTQGIATATRNLQARGRVAFHLHDVDLGPSPEPSAAQRGQRAQGALQLSTVIDADWVQVAPQLPPFESVSGTLTVRSGHLLHSTLTAKWLGGATILHLAERDRAGAGLEVQAEGALDARELVAASGIDTGGARVAGRTPWTGELAWDPELRAWHARADASFVGISSQLPDPLAKPEQQPAPFHVEVAASNGVGRARVAGESVSGAFELAARDDGVWLVKGGVLQFGGKGSGLAIAAARGAAAKGMLELRGALDSADLPAWLLAWHRLAAAPEALPVKADVKVGELTLAGRRYSDVTLTARSSHGTALKLDSAELAGTIDWPNEVAAQSPVKVHLERIDLQDSPAPLALAPLLGALGTSSEVQADDILWRGRSLGALDAHISLHGNVLLVDPLRFGGETQNLLATLRCRSAQGCRASFVVASHDAAQTLRDFGFRGDIDSMDAVLKGDLEWPSDTAPLDQAWLASVSGRVSVALANGSLRALPDDGGVPFALLPVTALLGDSHAQGQAQMAEPALAFSRLSADYSLRDGIATTSDLQFDGDAEILLDGRIGLTTRDYDCRAWILLGGERLPETLRDFLSTPRLAAAWMALRDLISGTDHASAELHLGGTWDAPEVESTLPGTQ